AAAAATACGQKGEETTHATASSASGPPRLAVALEASPATAQGVSFTATITNDGSQPAAVDGRWLAVASLVLHARDAGAGTGPRLPPPVPDNDADRGRVPVEPGPALQLHYDTNTMFGHPLPPGVYTVRVLYEPNRLQSDWLTFTVP